MSENFPTVVTSKIDVITKDAVWGDANDKYLLAVTLYVNATKLYYDSAHAHEVDYDTAMDLCKKGVARIFDTDTYYAVTSFKDDDGTLTIGYGASETVTVTDPSL